MNKNNSNVSLKITNPICYHYSLVWIYTSTNKACNSLVQIKLTNADFNFLASTLENNWFFIKDYLNKTNKEANKHLVYWTILKNKWGQNITNSELVNFLTKNNLHPVNLKDQGINDDDWYQINIKDAINLIDNLKQTPGNFDLHLFDKKFELRPDQQEAIQLTSYSFINGGKQFLWACKTGYGKQTCAMHLILQSLENKLNFKKIMICSNKVEACDEWFNAFKKSKMGLNGFKFYSKNNGNKLETLYRLNESKKAICFYNLLDLRSINFSNDDPFNSDVVTSTKWDLFIINEVDEGTKSILPMPIKKALTAFSVNAKWLHLADTAYKVLDSFHKNQIFTWSYLKEQEAKHQEENNPNNQYKIFPAIKQYLINVAQDLKIESELINTDNDDNGCLRYLFATKKVNDEYCFEKEELVKKFLDLLVDKNHPNYPFASTIYRQYFKHTFWFVANIAVGKALCKLLKHHPIFSNYELVDITNTNISTVQAKKLITEAISKNEFTITISCKRLVRDVMIPQWTAILYLAASMATSVIAYMQTVLRVQTPFALAKDDGYKNTAYLFDFAPHKAIIFREEVAKLQQVQSSLDFISIMQKSLEYMPIIGCCRYGFSPFNVSVINDEIQAYCRPINHNKVNERIPLIGMLQSLKHNSILDNKELNDADIVIVPAKKEVLEQQKEKAFEKYMHEEVQAELKDTAAKTENFFKRVWKKFINWLDKILP